MLLSYSYIVVVSLLWGLQSIASIVPWGGSTWPIIPRGSMYLYSIYMGIKGLPYLHSRVSVYTTTLHGSLRIPLPRLCTGLKD